MTQTHLAVRSSSPASGGHLVSTCGRTLPLRATRLEVRCRGGLAVVRVVQTFANAHAEPLQVRYQLPLPADAAVAGFAFVIGDRRVTGQIDRRAAARERFEQALAEGRTAALLEQERCALFSQELGNVPPGAEVTAEIALDQPLSWVLGQWEWRIPTTVAPRYMGAPGNVADAARLEVPVADAAIPPRLSLDVLVEDALVPGGAPNSPSHALSWAQKLSGVTTQLAGAPMDRDVVVRWPVAAPQPGVVLQCARPAAGAAHAHEAYGLLTLVPPDAGERAAHLPRDLIVLLDVSGSMQGQPLAAAQRVVGELLGSLDAQDRLEMIAFASRPQPWLGTACFATEGNKAAAMRWLMGLRASGGSEMRDAILAALQPLRGGVQRQVVLVTDGLIGFEEQIVAAIRTGSPASSRVHVVGVGSAPNRSLTRCASRAGRGIEVLVGLDEDAGPAARRLLARTSCPLVADLQLGGSALLGVCPEAPPDLFGGAPARLGLRLRPEGGTLRMHGATANGPFVHELHVAPVAAGTGERAVVRLVGREQVEDLETALAGDGDAAQLTAAIEQIGLQFGLATRATSWVAIDDRASVDPRDPRRLVDVPHELPYGMSVEGLGLRGAPRAVMSLAAPAAPMLDYLDAMQATMPASAGSADLADDEAAPPKAQPERRGFGWKKRAPMRKSESDRTKGPPPPRAHLRLRTPTEFVFLLSGIEQWSLPARIVLVFAEGEFVVTVKVERSTRSGALAAGTTIQLVTEVPVGLPAHRPVQLRLGEGADAKVLALA
ncbi:MAG TPA: VIT domain-containing protein [Planctomycetota bacterium]|nr:VIT domain-containing protein [Planctomycetota bacterium]